MTDSPSSTERGWLYLGGAARYLGVHFTTLRRWADAGEVPCLRTPGGRRRFSIADLDRFLNQMRGRSLPAAGNGLMSLQDRTLKIARREMEEHSVQQQDWVTRFPVEQRDDFRRYGRQFMGLLLQYGSCRHPGAAYLEQARRLAREHGIVCQRAGLTITETASAVLFFRHSLLQVVYEAGMVNGLDDAESRHLYQRLSDFLDAILLAASEGYSEAAARPAQANGAQSA